ncbi:MAG: hypothetical protein AAF750_12315 [Planctomycetota bacterium]
MVIGYHLIVTAYGFWLPNDPRGSWSTWVRAFEIYQAGGAAAKADTRRSVAGLTHDREQRAAAKAAMKFPAVRFDGRQAKAVGEGFGLAVKEGGYRVWACTVMPDHAHLVLGRHERTVERMRDHLKARGTFVLNRRGCHPLGGEASPWARKGWAVYLDDWADVERAVRYVEGNPAKAGLRDQRWSFVKDWRDESRR